MIIDDYRAIAEAMNRIRLEENPHLEVDLQADDAAELEEMTEEDIERARMLSEIVWY